MLAEEVLFPFAPCTVFLGAAAGSDFEASLASESNEGGGRFVVLDGVDGVDGLVFVFASGPFRESRAGSIRIKGSRLAGWYCLPSKVLGSLGFPARDMELVGWF